jgi:secreted trypsin-like serine protease
LKSSTRRGKLCAEEYSVDGGPLSRRSSDSPAFFLRGIDSFFADDDIAVYTDVSEYMDWIVKNMGP